MDERDSGKSHKGEIYAGCHQKRIPRPSRWEKPVHVARSKGPVIVNFEVFMGEPEMLAMWNDLLKRGRKKEFVGG